MMIVWCFAILLWKSGLLQAQCDDFCDVCGGNTCTKCQAGYYFNPNHNTCLDCAYTCKICKNDTFCISCASGDCDLCSGNCTNNTCQAAPCSECIDGYYLLNQHCFRCKNLGCKCKSDSECSGCLPGRYGENCKNTDSCPEQCHTCSSLVCTKCNLGYYGPTCASDCPADCFNHTCNKNNGICTKGCISGTYGLQCEFSCSQNCIDNMCNMSTGYCTKGCRSGFYSQNNVCHKCQDYCKKCSNAYDCQECYDGFYFKVDKCSNCPLRCASCTDFSHCHVCAKPHYWGPRCEYDCSNCRSMCNRTNGCSHQCDSSHYQEYIEWRHGYECHKCPDKCSSCINGSFCTACKPGFWGKICQYQCKDCADNVCNKDIGCGCNDGYFLVQNDTDYVCILCPDHCQICSDIDSCYECKEGSYLFNASCQRCSANCLDGEICNHINGTCSNGCKTGWWGDKCNNQCFPGCIDCMRLASGHCPACYMGYYGTNCEKNCSANCVSVGKEETCDKETGMCTHGCKDSFWGSSCSDGCSLGCVGSICNYTTGICLSGCKDDFYGLYCNHTCSANCGYPNTDATGRACDEVYGRCTYNCLDGLYGAFCSEECIGNCNGSVCNRDYGNCTLGCAQGFTGTDCRQAQVSEDVGAKQGSKDTVVIGAAVAACVAIVIILMIVTLLLVKRRQRLCKERENNNCAKLESPDSQFLEEEPTYNRIEDIQTEEIKDTEISITPSMVYPVSVTDKVKGKGIQQYQLATHINDGTNLLKHSNKENVDKSIIEEDMLEETEFAGEAEPNTYYNTTGRRVKIDELAEYVENRPIEDIIEEFKKLPMGLCKEKEYSSSRRPENILKNRYKFIYPYDESRVVLKDGDEDYINASYIEGFNGLNEYIGAMGPFQKGNINTVTDFWRMVWQEKCETIVMLTNLIENEMTKCEKYWPSPGTSQLYGTLHVACLTEDEYADFVVRTFRVIKDAKTLSVRHLHFTAWPDKTVPDDVTSMIEFRQKVRSLHGDKTCPIVVHCSAGIGRTGTFIALDILTFEGEARGYIDIYGCVATIRSQRVNLVQTPAYTHLSGSPVPSANSLRLSLATASMESAEQYVYLYHSVVHALTFDCRSIQADMLIEYYRKVLENTDGRVAIEKQFETLQVSFVRLSTEEGSNSILDKSLKNKMRKGTDVPDSEYRVRLRGNRKMEASNFINAVFVNGFRTKGKFILAQTPLPNTVVDFLSMILQEGSRCVIMMDEPNLQDKAGIKHKTDFVNLAPNVASYQIMKARTLGIEPRIYWPADNQVIKHGVFEVSCLESRTSMNFSSKKLQIRYTGQTKRQHNFHLYLYANWPTDRVVPRTPESLLELIKTVDMHRRSNDLETPVIIHCMTGSEKSCLYSAVSLLIEKIEIEHEVSVVNTLRQIKARRKSAIPCLEQYKFCHEAIICFLRSFDVYSNFGLRSSDTTAV